MSQELQPKETNGGGTSRRSLRALASDALSRLLFANRARLSFDGRRDLYLELGYPRKLDYKDYRERYERGDISEAIIEAYPRATWGSGASIIESPDPNVRTKFELEVVALFKRLDVWSRLYRSDILCGLGQYSVILIGGTGELSTELPRMTGQQGVLYLTPLGQERAKIEKRVADSTSERFDLPETYSIRISDSITKPTHWTRVIHVAKGLLEDDIFGKPDLQSIWNRLDDLDKIIGGGSEAAYQRQAPGMQLDVDKDMEFSDEDEKKLMEEVEEYRHKVNPWMRTRGVTVKQLMSDVNSFGGNVDTIIQIIAGAKRIPQRILTGSERGELASSQDRSNWNDRTSERRQEFAIPLLAQLLDRLIDYGALPQPEEYEVIWPEEEEMSEVEKIEVSKRAAEANKAQYEAKGGLILTSDEIRDEFLGLEPLEVDEVEDGTVNSIVEETPPVDEEIEEVTDELRVNKANDQRVIIIGGPRRGKSHIAKKYRDQGIPTFCSDPRTLVKDVEENVTYLPEDLDWSQQSQYIADEWISKPGPWCCEGVGVVRALRKVIKSNKLDMLSGVDILVLNQPHPEISIPTTTQQEALSKGVQTVWLEIAHYFPQAKVIGKPLEISVSRKADNKRAKRGQKVEGKLVTGQRYQGVGKYGKPSLRML